MTAYLIRRLLQAIPTLIGVTLLSFIIMRAAPGDPIQLMIFNPEIRESDRIALRHRLCLDRSLAEQYVIWVVGDFRGVCDQRGLIRGDFGTSFQNRRPALDLILERIPATLELTATALAVGLVVGLAIGVLAAVNQGGLFDNLTRFFAVILNALPSFWLGIMLLLFFGVQLGWLPIGGRTTLNVEYSGTFIDRARHLFMPVLVLAVGWIAVLSRFMRTQTLEVVRQEYVRTAHAKGLAPRRVYFMHAARNALIPIATILGPAIGGLIGGSVITERIFSWPGLGRLTLDAVFQRDYPLIMAGVLIGAVLVILGNLLSDVLYGIIDPRIRLE